jgi:hypothetical protein
MLNAALKFRVFRVFSGQNDHLCPFKSIRGLTSTLALNPN